MPGTSVRDSRSVVRRDNTVKLTPKVSAIQTFTITNGSDDRTYDANASSVNELADILYTLIGDLAEQGLIKRA
jgi:hypothetical protein